MVITDMETVYNDAAGRSSAGDFNLKEGSVGGTTFKAGVFTWGTYVNIASDIYYLH